MTQHTTLRIYAADLAAYNAGRLRGVWIDLDGKDADAIDDEINAMLARSPESNVLRRKCNDCGRHYDVTAIGAVADCPRCGSDDAGATFRSAEEYAIHDHEGLAPFIGSNEWPNLGELAELAQLLAEDDDAKRRGALYLAWNGATLREAIDQADNVITCPMEGLETLADVAEVEFSDAYSDTLDKLPDWIRGNIDWAGVANDMRCNGDYVEVTTAGERFAVVNACGL